MRLRCVVQLGMDASIETKVTTKELLRLAVTMGGHKEPVRVLADTPQPQRAHRGPTAREEPNRH